MGTLAGKKQHTPHCKSLLFHPVLKDSWIITAHISLSDLNRQLYMFNPQKTSAHQLLVKLQCQLLVSHLYSMPFYINFPTYTASMNPTNQPYDQQYSCSKQSEFENLSPPENPWSKRSLLPFLGDALKCLTDTATTEDTQEIKQCANQLILEQTKQQ